MPLERTPTIVACITIFHHTMQLPILYPNGCIIVPKTELDTSDRERAVYGDIKAFGDSLIEFGIIHPPLVTDHPRQPGKILITGGRRIAGMMSLGMDHFPVIYRPNIPEEQFKELELEENEQRLGMEWQEKVRCIVKSHKMRVSKALQENKNWTQRQSGSVFGCSHTHVQNCILLYDYLVAGDQEICTADTVSDALAIIIARQEEAAQKELARRAAAQMFIPGAPIPMPTGDSSPTPLATKPIPTPKLDNESTSLIAGFLEPLAPKPSPTPPQLSSGQISCQDGSSQIVADAKRFPISKRFLHGNCLEIMASMPAMSTDHIVTDPPYAVNMENMKGIQDIGIVKEEHDIEENLTLLTQWFPLAYRLIRLNGFCVLWYDLDHHEKLQTLARKAGFTVQRWPITWHKLSNCKNDAAQYNFTKTTEHAMVLRKGNATLVKPQPTSVVQCDGTLEQQMYNNPFAKPFQVWKFIYDAIAIPGQMVLDPFGGEFSSARAAINCGLLPTCIELKENHYNKGVNDIRELVNKISGGNVIFE